jgi:lysophospholipase L1-like esterase
MNVPGGNPDRGPFRRRLRHLAGFAVVFIAQFAMFEIGLRTWGSSEAGPSFQGLFEDDPAAGFRLKPHARIRFTTAEFDAEIAVNGLGVRDDEEIGAKAVGEQRILILGDSLVLSVQVPFEQTFGELLEAELNARSNGLRYRVINAGVQGYGPVEELIFFKRIAASVQPDLVITTVFVGNDAEEAVASRGKLDGGAARRPVRESAVTRLRRLLRRSMVWQILRLRVVSAAGRFTDFTRPEPPVQSYAARPAPRIAEGLAITRQCLQTVASESSRLGARSAIALMPARFQVDDGDYGRLREIVSQAGGELVRDAATARFDSALSELPVPRVDLLPALRRALPGPDLFYQTTVHLTPRGHRVVAETLAAFIRTESLLAPPSAALGR